MPDFYKAGRSHTIVDPRSDGGVGLNDVLRDDDAVGSDGLKRAQAADGAKTAGDWIFRCGGAAIPAR